MSGALKVLTDLVYLMITPPLKMAAVRSFLPSPHPGPVTSATICSGLISFYLLNQLLLPRRPRIWIPSWICPEIGPITGRLVSYWTGSTADWLNWFSGAFWAEEDLIWDQSLHPRGCDVIMTGRGVPPGYLTQNFPGSLTAANRFRCLIRRGQSSHPIPAWATLHHAMLADLSTHWLRFGYDKSLKWTCGPAPPTGTEKLGVNHF